MLMGKNAVTGQEEFIKSNNGALKVDTSGSGVSAITSFSGNTTDTATTITIPTGASSIAIANNHPTEPLLVSGDGGASYLSFPPASTFDADIDSSIVVKVKANTGKNGSYIGMVG